jgi:hypothetical protein
MSSIQDVDGNRILDMVVHVATEALQLSESDREALLEGQMTTGKRFKARM